MIKTICFKKEKIKGRYRYHFIVLGEAGKEATRFGVESKTKLGKIKLKKRAIARIKKLSKIFPNPPSSEIEITI